MPMQLDLFASKDRNGVGREIACRTKSETGPAGAVTKYFQRYNRDDVNGNSLETADAALQSVAAAVTTTAMRLLVARSSTTCRRRIGIGHESGADIYLYFGAGAGKTASDCYGPISSGSLWEVSDGVWQGEVWAVCATGTATVHPMEWFS